MIQMRNRVSCTEVKGAEIKWMDVSIFRRETCQELAIDWPWGLRDGLGLSGLGNCKDGPENPGFTEIKIREEDKVRGTAGCKCPPLPL